MLNRTVTLLAALAVLALGPTSRLRAADATTPPAPATPPAAPAKQVVVDPPAGAALTLARNGTDVLVAWSLPPGDYKLIDVIRHIQIDPKGRTRLATIAATKTTYLDTLPDKTVTYWYWIKITQADRSVFNVGPVISKPAEVWTP